MLGALELDVVRRKLELVAESWGVSYEVLLNSTLKGMEDIARVGYEALSFRGSVGYMGYHSIVVNWESAVKEAEETLGGELL